MLAVKSLSCQFNIGKRLIVRVYQCARQIELEQIVACAYPDGNVAG
jgi:hypothetical protein